MKPLETTPGWRPHTSTNGHAPQGAFWRGDAFFVSPLCPLQGGRVAPAEPDTLVEIGEYLQVVQETHDYIKDLVPELVPEQP